MSLLTRRIKFKIANPAEAAGSWKVSIRDSLKTDLQHFKILHNDVLVVDETLKIPATEVFNPVTFHIDLEGASLGLEIGHVTLMKMGVVTSLNGVEIHRTHTKPFRGSGKMGKFIAKIEADANKPPPTPEELAVAERQKALRPSIAIDFALGFLFFFIAREYGLLAASLAGSGVTILLTIANRFVKPDLLGGFAVFGVVMALISALLTLLFQDDLFIKLRGSLMGTIGASLAFADGIFNNGNYMGRRIAMYMEGLFKLNQRRAAFAMGGSMIGVIMTDLPLVFLLTTDQWIWYNAFLDGIVSMAIFFAAMMFAREPKQETNEGHLASEHDVR